MFVIELKLHSRKITLFEDLIRGIRRQKGGITMTWKEEKQLVKNVVDEKKDLFDLISMLNGKDINEISDVQKQLLERYQELEILMNRCFEVLSEAEKEIITCSYIKRMADFELAITIGVSERTACTYKKNATIKLANLITFYLS